MSEDKGHDVVITHEVTETVHVDSATDSQDAQQQAHKSESGKGKENVKTVRSEPSKDKKA